VYFITLPFLVRKIFTFYINDVLLFKCPFPGPKVKKTLSDPFVKFRKEAIRYVMCGRMEQLDSHCTDSHEIWYLLIFRKSVEKFQFLK